MLAQRPARRPRLRAPEFLVRIPCWINRDSKTGELAKRSFND